MCPGDEVHALTIGHALGGFIESRVYLRSDSIHIGPRNSLIALISAELASHATSWHGELKRMLFQRVVATSTTMAGYSISLRVPQAGQMIGIMTVGG